MDNEPITASDAPAGEANANGPFALLLAERKRLEQFAREQFALIREAREKFISEKQTSEQVLESRRTELERQTQSLLVRLHELHEKEQQFTEQMEDVIPERHAGLARREPTPPAALDSLADTTFQEVILLRHELEEKQQRIEQLQAERDIALEQVRQLQQPLEPNPAAEEELPEQWAEALVEQSPLLQQKEVEKLRGQLDDLRQQMDHMRAERDTAWADLRRLPPPPEEVVQQEAEFVALRRQLEQERRKLEEMARDMHLGEVELHKRKDACERGMAERRQQLDRRASELAERQLRIEEKAGELRLHEAELREMKEIVERDTARERAELLLERLRIARLREALRMEQEALKAAAAERQGASVKPTAAASH
jgi:hypothetical protein